MDGTIPREAVLYIFQHLNFYSLVRCSQVSRLFRHYQYLVDLDLSNCHIINTGSFGIWSKLTTLQQLNLYQTQIGNGDSVNPWQVQSIQAFSCLKCPE